jgi:hypothetical protein
MAKTKKEVIVVQNREGCFLQTLNFGCAVIFIIVAIVIVLAVLGSLL